MQELQKQINQAMRKLEEKFSIVGVKTEQIKYGIKATIYTENTCLMDGFSFPSDFNTSKFEETQLNAILNAIKNYDLTLLD